MISATPKYVADAAGDFKSVPPGHRFGLYFPAWNAHSWMLEKTRKSDALRQVLNVSIESRQQVEALRTRQFALVNLAPDNAKLTLEAQSISPLATGMGMEHPLENGFAFLNPYGLPYLPGSSIKGVLRRAAEELSDANEAGWSDPAIDILFGKEVEAGDTQTQRTRGALTFWDSIPELAGNTMGMDVMTPHYSDYYQGNSTPHDAGSPNPIVFMVIPPQSRFSFYLTASTSRLQDLNNWQALMQVAFEYAFKWLGFGAKTAVGYGAMIVDEEAISDPTDKAAIKWLQEKVEIVKQDHNIPDDKQAYASKPLAEEWQLIEDSEFKQAVLSMLEQYWEKFERSPSKKAKVIYSK